MKSRDTVLGGFLILLVAICLLAQQEPPQSRPTLAPQKAAPTDAERHQALQAIMAASKPEEQAVLIEEYLQKYPDTPETAELCWRASFALRQTNNYAKAAEYGERAVALRPQHFPTLVLVADVLAEGSSPSKPDLEKLARAEKYARQALDSLPQFLTTWTPPTSLTPEEVEAQQQLLEAQPHATLGFIHLVRSENALAEQELVKATELGQAQPNPMDYLRLGRAYFFQDKLEPAVVAFRKAVAMGGPLYETARRHLQVAEDALARRQRTAPRVPESKPPTEKPPQPPAQP